MVALVSFRHAEAESDLVQKSGFTDLQPCGAEILFDMENEFVGSRLQIGASQQWPICSAIGIGFGFLQEAKVAAVETPKFQTHTGGGPTLGCIEDMGGEFSHGVSVTRSVRRSEAIFWIWRQASEVSCSQEFPSRRWMDSKMVSSELSLAQMMNGKPNFSE